MTDKIGNAYLCISLKMFSGFFEDYMKIILKSQHELIIVINNGGTNILVTTSDEEKLKIKITKLCWRVPHLAEVIPKELTLGKIIDKNRDILLTFQSWELIEYPKLLV